MNHEDIQERAMGTVDELLDNEEDPYPKVVEIHPTDKCNHRCDYCFHGGTGHDPKREDEVFSVSQYEELFDEISDLGVRHLSVAGGGEPLMDQRTATLYELAGNHGLRVRTVSNGNFLNENILKSLLDTSEIRVSVDAASPETYSTLRNIPGEYYEHTINNMETILAERTRCGSDLQVGTTFLINDINKDEAVQFAEEMVKRGVDAVVFKYDIYGLVTTESEELARIQRELEDIDEEVVEVRTKLDMDVPDTRCFIPYFKIAITPYGEVFSCCLGSQPGEDAGYMLGRLHDRSFEEIWKDSADIRQEMRNDGVHCGSCNHTDYKINQKMETLQE